MRVLIVTGNFAGPRTNPWLLDDLTHEFAARGDRVDVILHDTKTARPRGISLVEDGRVRVMSVGPARLFGGPWGKALGFLNTIVGLHTRGIRHVRRHRYDLCIYTSIGLFSWGFPARLRAANIARRAVFILWDFFPVHQLEIGRIPRWSPARILRAVEAMTFRQADVVALMSPANEAFFHSYHPSARNATTIIPPWAAIDIPDDVRKRQNFTVVFGGQLTLGRGVGTLLEAAAILQREGVEIELLIVGSGPTRGALEDMSASLALHNTTLLGALPRDEYRKLLATVHVGIAVTVPGVSPPTFPSKIAEYSGVGLPVIVCVERSSDAGSLVCDAGAGLSVPAGDAVELAGAIAELAGEHERGSLVERSKRARILYERELSVAEAVQRLKGLAVEEGGTPSPNESSSGDARTS
ncbi:glycosyltransferase family 4 protein [Humibacter antri]